MKANTDTFDLVDSQGTIQQYSVAKTDVKNFSNLYKQIVVGCIFNAKNELLVQRRSLEKRVEPGKLDQVCGFVDAGEKPEEAVIRESLEEAHVHITSVKLIHTHINSYNAYRYLFVGFTEDIPETIDTHEVEWVKFVSIDELKTKAANKEWEFVNDFFDDVDLATRAKI